jgi:hypothetical protein
MIAKMTRSDEIAQKVSASRLEFYTKEMVKDIGHNMSNISILTNQYLDRCKDAIENPEVFMQTIIKEVGVN